MQRPKRYLRLLGLSLGLMVACTSLTLAQDRVRAKLGIEIRSGDQVSRAKIRDHVQVGDLLRVYIAPTEDAYVYVVYSDGKDVALLNSQEHHNKIMAGKMLILPAWDEFYQVSPGSTAEYVTIICSHETLPAVTALLTSGAASPAQWAEVEDKLLAQGTLRLDGPIDKPAALAGNTRTIQPDGSSETFLASLPTFSGAALLVKKYAFTVTE